MFKNLMIYALGEAWHPQLADVEAALQSQTFTPCTALQDKSVGWVPPRGQAHGALVEAVAGHWVMRLMIETRSVPASVVRREAEQRIAEIEQQTGIKPGRKVTLTFTFANNQRVLYDAPTIAAGAPAPAE